MKACIKSIYKSLVLTSIIVLFGACTISAPNFGYRVQRQPSTYYNPNQPQQAQQNPQQQIIHALQAPDTAVGRDGEDPFPFDLNVDSIAYMSCPNTDFIFPHFYFGSFDKGVVLSEDFTYRYKNREYENALRKSPFFNSSAQISLSPNGNPTQILQVNNTARDCRGSGARFPSFQYSDSDDFTGKKGVLDFNGQDLKANLPSENNSLGQIISYLDKGDFNFSLIYTYDNDDRCSPFKNQTGSYHGRYYKMNFAGGQDQLDHLSAVTEYTHDHKNRERWDCREELRIPILRHSSIVEYLYNQGNNRDHFKSNGALKESQCRPNSKILSSSRRRLVEDFLGQNFDLGEIYEAEHGGEEGYFTEYKATNKPCIVPKRSQANCYNRSAVVVTGDDDCTHLNNFNRCRAYLSICIK